MLAVHVGHSLGLLIVFGELHRSLTALGQQRPVGQKRLFLPCGHVDAIGEAILLESEQRQRHRRPEHNFKLPTEQLNYKQDLLVL